MVYTQMIFALAFDKLVFGSTPDIWSIVGSSLVLGSALYIAVYKEPPRVETAAREAGDEHAALLEDDGEQDDARSADFIRRAENVQVGAMRQ